MNKSKYFAFLLFIAFALTMSVSGCKVGPDYVRSDYKNSPTTFRFGEGTPDSVINIKWWELFNDPNLKILIETALKNNQDILIAASRIEESRAVVGFKKADQYPVVDYKGNASRTQQNIPALNTSGPFNDFSAIGVLSWEIDFWGKYRRGTEAARAELLASHFGRRALQIELISEVTQTYFLLQDYRNRLKISEKTLESRKESSRIVAARFDKGIVPEIDLNQAQIQEAIAEAAIPLYARLVAQTENTLSVLLGEPPRSFDEDISLRDQITPPEIPEGIPSDILLRRPDVLEAEQYVAAQTAQIGVAQAMRFPSISLTATLGAATSDLSTLGAGNALAWSLGGGIFGPILNFGKNKRRVEIERQRMIQDSLYYVRTILNTFREVEDALIEVTTLKSEAEARFKQMVAAQNAASLSYARYDGGVTSYLEVLDSERSKFDAELAASETYQLYLSSYIKLYEALGGGWITEQEMQQSQNPGNN
jgi:outer membrane protein, multidrug efflux system